MKVAATIAILNEAENIGSVLSRIPPYVNVVVVDDGSVDGSEEIIRQHGAKVVKHPYNLGQGAGIITGFRACLLEDCDVIIELDGDGQHDPAEIPKFLQAMEETQADIVVGSRILGTNYQNAPFLRRRLLPHLTSIINRITGYNMTDSMCGFRAFNAESLRRVEHVFNEMDEPQYLAAEMFIRFSREGLTVAEIPINLSDRSSGISRKGLARYGWGVAKAILKTTLKGRP